MSISACLSISPAGGQAGRSPLPLCYCAGPAAWQHLCLQRAPLRPAPLLSAAGTNIGGGTFWGLCKLLTGMDSFDDILALSSQGDNSNVSPAHCFVCL